MTGVRAAPGKSRGMASFDCQVYPDPAESLPLCIIPNDKESTSNIVTSGIGVSVVLGTSGLVA